MFDGGDGRKRGGKVELEIFEEDDHGLARNSGK